MNENKNRMLQNVVSHLKTISSYQPEVLIRANDNKNLSFIGVEETIYETIKLANDLLNLELKMLPSNLLSQMENPFKDIAKTLENISNFNFDDLINITKRMTSMSEQLEGNFSAVINSTARQYAYLCLRNDPVKEKMHETVIKIEGVENEINALGSKAKVKSNELKKRLTIQKTTYWKREKKSKK